MAIRMLPEALMPGYIFNWQLGAWGEQMTAIQLRALPRKEWVVRHDLRWGERGNHDHLVAGSAVFVLNTKNVKDSRVEIEGENLRVHRIDDPDNSYLADRWVPTAASEARSLGWKLTRELGHGVTVYPVIVIWGDFDLEPHWVGDDVFIVNGQIVADFIQKRPADLVMAKHRQAVMEYVRSMPRAS